MKVDIPLVGRVWQYAIELDDEDQLDPNRMLMADPRLLLERKRHQVPLKMKDIVCD